MRTALRQTRRFACLEYELIQRSTLLPFLPEFQSRVLSQTTSSSRPLSTRVQGLRLPAVQAIQQPHDNVSQITSHGTSTLESEPRRLPRACPGCGAPSQSYDKIEPGYYDVDRKAVRQFLEQDDVEEDLGAAEDELYKRTLDSVDSLILEKLGVNQDQEDTSEETSSPDVPTPVCDRCHKLIHHHAGTPISHPSVEALQQTIAESPHRRNHIYHVIDAADFPLSLVPNLQASLRLPKLRTQNRRAKHKGWVANDRIAEVSFIITRSDLLAPKKEQVDALMPYIQDVLRDALGRTNKLARLGNVRLVSAQRGWWTKQIKEDIWYRGGAGWMVGRVNVGKSGLFEAVFPKGRGADYQNVRKIRTLAEREAMLASAKTMEEVIEVQRELAQEDEENERLASLPRENMLDPTRSEDRPEMVVENEDDQDLHDDPNALLPPAQPYTPYPVLPIVSALPGTTASPIRIPFGRDRGELVDLPGLARTQPGLESFIQPDFHGELIMKHRINAERYVLKPGQSLLLGGGLIRITPTSEDLTFLVYPFVPIKSHVTRTDKAVEYQAQTSERSIDSILAPDVGPSFRSAGLFPLRWDVTKKTAGALTSSVAAKMRPDNLPFRVFGTDLLIEGVGWLEVSAQIRRPQGWRAPGMVKKDPNHARAAKLAAQEREQEERQRKYEAKLQGEDFFKETEVEEDVQDVVQFPEVEVFSPLGKFVGARKPMCASVVSGPKIVSSRERTARPRRSMKSVKAQRRAGGA